MDILMIAHFITEFHAEGTSRFIYLSEYLSKNNEVELITSEFDHISKTKRVKKKYDLQTKITFLSEPMYPKNVCLSRFISHKKFGENVKEYISKRKKPDMIYCAVPSLDCAYYAARYARENNIRFVIDIQDLWPEAFKMIFKMPIIKDILFYPMKKKADYIYETADYIVGVSKTYCERALLVNKKVVNTIPVFLGTKIKRFDMYVKNHRVSATHDTFKLGYCGTLGHSYDIKCVMDAISKLKAKGVDNLEFWIMGDGPLKETFQKYAKKKSVNAKFWGRVPYEKMCGLLSECDVCMNVINKGAANSVINKHGDYAASGLPVINTQDNDEYKNLVRDYECGINCSCSNSDEVVEAIIELMNNPEKEEQWEEMLERWQTNYLTEK